MRETTMKYLTFLLLLYPLLSFFVSDAHAAVSEDERFRIKEQTVDILPYRQATPPPQSAPQEKSLKAGTNFVVRTTNPESFLFQLNNSSLDFDKPEATVPVIRTSILTIISNTPYVVFASQDHELAYNNRGIPNTTCDNGSCSETLASLWKNNLTYGIGFRCDSIKEVICPEDFQPQYYRPFANRAQGQEAQIIMKGSKTKKTEGKISYKLITSGTQQQGAYRNTIQYIAVPDF